MWSAIFPVLKGLVNSVTWVVDKDDHKKIKRIVLLMLLTGSLCVNALYFFQDRERSKRFKARGISHTGIAGEAVKQ